jgi:prepilin-type N-terminal cleavage/methylation domain-containing protein
MKKVGKPYEYALGFTIVELLVVIVVIGILAAISVISYNGITQKANTAALQSDLDNSRKLMLMYQIENGQFPATLNANGCPATPVLDTTKCIKASGSNTITYNPSFSGTSATGFTMTATSGSIALSASDTQAIGPISDNLDYGLVAEWKFNGDVLDSTGNIPASQIKFYANGSTATPTTPTYSSGADNAASGSLFINGASSQYLDAGNSSKYNTQEITFSAWVKSNSSASFQSIIAKEFQYKYRINYINTSGVTSGDSLIGVALNTNGQYNVSNPSIGGWDILTQFNTKPSVSMMAGSWYHIVATISTNNNIIKVYINGELVGSSTFIGFSPINFFNNNKLYLGAYCNTNDLSKLCANNANMAEFFSGYIDDARVYSWALDQSFVRALYSAKAK